MNPFTPLISIAIFMAGLRQGHSATMTLFPEADTVIKKKQEKVSFGSSQSLEIDKKDEKKGASWALLKFDLSNVSSKPTKAQLKLYVYDESEDDASIEGFRMEESWNEQSTWKSLDKGKPEHANSASFAIPEPDVVGFKLMDVTSDVILWLDGDLNEGWLITSDSENGLNLDSSETTEGSQYRPQLILDFDGASPVTTTTTSQQTQPTSTTEELQTTTTTVKATTTTSEPSELGNVVTLFAAADTEIKKKQKKVSFGSSTTLTVDKTDEDKGNAWALIKFDLSSLGGSRPQRADLKLYAFDESSASAVIEGYRMEESWDSDSTWKSLNKGNPDLAKSPSFRISSPDQRGWKVMDVSSDIEIWMDGEDNEGWLIISESEDGIEFYSSETQQGAAYAPQLVLYFEDTVTTTTTRASSSETVAPTTTTTQQVVTSSSTQAVTTTSTAETTTAETTTTTAASTTTTESTVGSPTTVIIKGTKVSDTTIRETSSTTNLGSSTVLEVDEFSAKHILLKFDLDEITGGRITFAELKMNQFDEGNLGAEITGHRMFKSWNEDSTWSSLGGPYPDGTDAASSPSFYIEHPLDNGLKYMNVKADVNAWVNGGEDNQGWLIVSDSSNGLDFYSSETSDGPELMVTYIPGPISPTPAPTDAPTKTPPMCPNGPASYYPGKLETLLGTDYGDSMATGNILVSKGLTGRVLTRSLQPVPVAQGGPTFPMHENADGAATFQDDNDPQNKYYYVSNSETGSKTSTMGADGSGGGGVGILHFDATKTPHEVIGYERAAYDTESGGRNCGGGRTPWGTWLTSEESDDGQVIEVDPNTGDWCQTPLAPSEGGNYESNAFYKHPVDGKFHFYTTDDASSNYRLTRFITQRDATDLDNGTNKPRLCDPNDKYNRNKMEGGSIDFLHLVSDGTYYWDTERSETVGGDVIYPNAEGIDVKGDQLYFVTKGQKKLYIVDLDSNTWTETRTLQDDNSYFSPDQIARITGSNYPEDILYFVEDGSGSQDVHARGLDPDDGEYKFYTIIQGYSSTESTGLTFSPDNKYMYFAHQGNSEIWQIWREDGCEFGNGSYIDVLYHDGQRRQLGGLRGGRSPVLMP